MQESLEKTRILFYSVIDVAPEKRSAVLDRLCEGDETLRSSVQRLLDAFDEAPSVLDSPFGDKSLTRSGTHPQVGDTCGPYRLIEVIGEGGFGKVFAAEQLKPIKRIVALKIVKPGMDSAQVLARFDTEKQSLAILAHPNIARIFDAGISDDGLPYFAMELVPGQSITRFCDGQRYSIRSRIELMIQVSQAVHQAHQKGIIHRDIKPSNVLVGTQDGKPIPKVIDFGVAKALEPLTSSPIETQELEVIGSPLYMSPEQARESRDVDVRADVYSLGVVLYELLCGSTPLDKASLVELSRPEIRERIQTRKPTPPSRKLGKHQDLPEIAAHRSTSPTQLERTVSGDLDRIVMMSLELDREQRYQSADDFGRDLQRWLDHKPVAASAPTPLYTLARFAKRHRTACWIAGSMIGVLFVALLVCLQQISMTREAELRANASLNHMLGMIAKAAPGKKGHGLSVLAAAQESIEELIADPSIDDRTKAELLTKYGRELAHLESGDILIGIFEQALAFYKSAHASDTRESFDARSGLAGAHLIAGNVEDARNLADEVLRQRDPHPSPYAIVAATVVRAWLLDGAAQNAEKESQLLKAHDLAQAEKLVGLVALSMKGLSHHYASLQDYERAFEWAQARVELANESFEKHHYETALAQVGLAEVYVYKNQGSDAIRLIEEALPLLRNQLRPEHPILLRALTYKAKAHRLLQELDTSQELLDEGLAIVESPTFSDLTAKLNFYTELLLTRGNLGLTEGNVEIQQKLLSIVERKYGVGSPRALTQRVHLALAYVHDRDLQMANDLLQHVQDKYIETLGKSSVRAHQIAINRATILNEMGRVDEAIETLEQVLDNCVAALQPYANLALGKCLLQRDELERAIVVIERSFPPQRKFESDELNRFSIDAQFTIADAIIRRVPDADEALTPHQESQVQQAISRLTDCYQRLTADGAVVGGKKKELLIGTLNHMVRAANLLQDKSAADAWMQKADELDLEINFSAADSITK